MPGSYEDLLVRIDATTEQLRREMKRGEETVSSFQRNVDRHLTKVDKSFDRLDRMARSAVAGLGLLGGALSIGAMTRFATDTVAAADKVAKLSNQIGVNSTSLQEWQFAASQASIPVGVLETSLERLTRRIGEARHGQGELVKISDELGLSLGSTEETFLEIADAIKNAKDEQEATRIAFKAFDSEGRVLTRVLRDGRQGLREYGDEAQRLGIVLSSDNLAKAEAISDELDKLNKVIRVNLQEGLLTGLGTDIDEFSNAISPEMAQSLQDIGEGMGSAFKWVIENRESIIDTLETIGGALTGRFLVGLATASPHLRAAGLVAGALASTDAADELGQRVELGVASANRRAGFSNPFDLNRELNLASALPKDEQLRYLRQWHTEMQTLAATYDDAALAMVDVDDRIYELTQGTEDVLQIVIPYRKEQEKANTANQAGAKAAQELAEKLDKLQARYDDGFANIVKYQGAQADLKLLYDNGRISLDEWTDALNNQQNELAGMDEAVEEAAQGVGYLAAAFDEAIRRIDTSFTAMWRSVLGGAETTFEAIRDTLRDLGAEVLHAHLTRPLVGAAAGGLGLALPGAASAGTAAGVGGLSSLFSGANLLGGLSAGSSIIQGAGYFGGIGATANFATSALGAGNLGAALGAAAPYLAPLALAVPLLSGLFKDKTDPRVGLKTGGEYFEDNVYQTSAFGRVGFRAASHGMDAGDESWQALLSTIVALDNTIASLMSESEVSSTTSRLHGFMGELRDLDGLGDEDLARLIADRMQVVVAEMSGVIGDAFRAVIAQFSGSTEDLIAMTSTLAQISAQLDVDVLSEYQRQVEMSSRSLTDTYFEQGMAVRDLAAGLDASVSSVQALADANANRMQIELQLLGQLDAAAASIEQTLGGTIESITLDLLDQEGKYDRIRGQAEALAASLDSMMDPTRIEETVAEIDRLTNAAYGLLDDSQRADMGQEFIGFLQDVEALAQAKLDQARQDVVTESAALRDVIESAFSKFAGQISQAASTMQSAASTMQSAANSIPRTIQVVLPGLGEVNG